MIAAKTNHFTVSDTILVGDPCYDQGEIQESAKPGRWLAKAFIKDAGDWGRRVARAVVHHESWIPGEGSLDSGWFFVDSGMAGVFVPEVWEGHGVFYDECCSKANPYGFVRGGFVTSSGYGDGGYRAEIHRVRGRAVAVELVFIPEQTTVQA